MLEVETSECLQAGKIRDVVECSTRERLQCSSQESRRTHDDRPTCRVGKEHPVLQMLLERCISLDRLLFVSYIHQTPIKSQYPTAAGQTPHPNNPSSRSPKLDSEGFTRESFVTFIPPTPTSLQTVKMRSKRIPMYYVVNHPPLPPIIRRLPFAM